MQHRDEDYGDEPTPDGDESNLAAEAIGQRLFEAISSKKMKIKQFARESGIKYPSLRDYYKGKRKPGFLALAALLRFTGVSGDWLLLGKGQMFTDEEPPPADVDERLLALIAQSVEKAFLKQEDGEADEVREVGADYLNKRVRKQMQRELNRVGDHTVIAASVYNRVVRLAPEERNDHIEREAIRLVRLHRSLSLTHLDEEDDAG